jgi:hypothetical protein
MPQRYQRPVGCTNSIFPAKTPIQPPQLTSPRRGRITPKNSEVDRPQSLLLHSLCSSMLWRWDGCCGPTVAVGAHAAERGCPCADSGFSGLVVTAPHGARAAAPGAVG